MIGQQITCLDIESEISKDERVGGEGPEEEEEEGVEEGNLDRKSFHGSGSLAGCQSFGLVFKKLQDFKTVFC